MNGVAVAILGGSGYGGGELLRLLHGATSPDQLQVASRSHAGRWLHDVHPHLRGIVPGRFQAEIDWSRLAEHPRPVLFAALPHGEFAKLYPGLRATWSPLGLDERLLVIDLSGDFRLADAEEYARAYGHPHPCPEHLSDFVYGLAEWNAARITGARRIANPGCFATALALGLLPLGRLERPPEFVAIAAATGSSGSGASASDTTHHPTRAHDLRAYKVLGHQHEWEVRRCLAQHGVDLEFGFVPHSAPLVRGIYATLQFRAPGLERGRLEQVFRRAYPEGGFVRLVEGAPRLLAVVGSNYVDLGLAAAAGCGAVLVALDNLVKGMAGQALQNMNLALGRPADQGLRQSALYPA